MGFVNQRLPNAYYGFRSCQSAIQCADYEIGVGTEGLHSTNNTQPAKVAELVDALDLGSSAARRESSSLSFRTKIHELRNTAHGNNC